MSRNSISYENLVRQRLWLRRKKTIKYRPKSLAEQGLVAIIAGSLDLAGPGVGQFWSKRVQTLD